MTVITRRLLAVMLLLLLYSCNDGRTRTAAPGDDTASPVVADNPGQPVQPDTPAEQQAINQAAGDPEAWREADQVAERAAQDEAPTRSGAVSGDREAYIADRTTVAEIILPALQAYYEHHREYPPFLKGREHADDPLIDGGYLAAYPLMWPQPAYQSWGTIEVPDHPPGRWGCNYLAAALPVEQRDRTWFYGTPSEQYGYSMANNYFGYARGDLLGAGAGEAWLWFYGSNIWPERNNPIPDDLSTMQAEEYYELFTQFFEFGPRGLDLLNDKTHELSPDGRPDGICLLYRVRDGELVEVIRADGI